MAKLPIEFAETIWALKRKLLEIIDAATAAEESLFSTQGETELTIAVLDELKQVSERATPWFSRLSNLQVRIAESQPDITFDMLDLLNRTIDQIQIETPALERSIQEVKQDWNLS
jgi:hypothetical protein